MALNLRIVNETEKFVYVGWDPDLSGQGYRFYVDGAAVSRSFKPEASSTRFSKPDAGAHRYGVQKMDVVDALEEIQHPAALPPLLTVSQSIVQGQTLSGSLPWTAVPSGTVQKIEFYIDGALRWTENFTPYMFNGDGGSLDTTTLANGSHSFEVRAYVSGAVSASASATAQVENAQPPAGGLLKSEDFEAHPVGNYVGGAIFQGAQQKAAGRVQVVASPTRLGTRALRIECRDGDSDVAGSGSGERAEVCCGSFGLGNDTPDGLVRWFNVSVLFPTNFVPAAGTEWNYIWQIHQNGGTPLSGGQVPQAFTIASNGLDVRLAAYGGSSPSANSQRFTVISNFKRDIWYDMVLGVLFADDPSGWIEVWVNGNSVVPRTFRPTRYTATGGYLKAGIYRSGSATQTSVIYHDEFRIGENRAAVTL